MLVLKKEEGWCSTAPAPCAECLDTESLNTMLALTLLLGLRCPLYYPSVLNPENSVHPVAPADTNQPLATASQGWEMERVS